LKKKNNVKENRNNENENVLNLLDFENNRHKTTIVPNVCNEIEKESKSMSSSDSSPYDAAKAREIFLAKSKQIIKHNNNNKSDDIDILNIDFSNDCGVCKLSLHNNDHLFVLPECKHKFHLACKFMDVMLS
jgi:hypothetical protein